MNIKQTRLELSLTQKDIAQALQISKRQYIYYEQNEKQVPQYITLALRHLLTLQQKGK